jgi:hypothetical protein
MVERDNAVSDSTACRRMSFLGFATELDTELANAVLAGFVTGALAGALTKAVFVGNCEFAFMVLLALLIVDEK